MIDVVLEDEVWLRDLPDATDLASRCFEETSRLEPAVRGNIALLLTDDAAIKALNAQFRGMDKPTNVLSFPSDEDDFLGDIALARETAIREAEQDNISLRDHTAHLLVHGMLHLTGYDHETDIEASKMERLEIEVLQRLGVANPYAPAETTP